MSAIVLIDDDVEFAALLAEYLRREGFLADATYDGESGIQEALSGRYALAVIDMMMPKINGVEALRRIRSRSAVPVLMLTARSDDYDRVVCLELGADDFVSKTCSPREVAARIRAILRRAHNGSTKSAAEPLVVGPLVIWPEQRRAEYSAQRLRLTSTEYGLLEVLARNAGRTVSKHDLSQMALGRPLHRFDRSIDVHLSSIRRKLGMRADGRSCIQTIFRKGYQLLKE